MKIIICEDNKKILDFIKKTIENYITIHELDATIAFENDNPEKILEYVTNNELGNCYFLDIDLGEGNMSGVELGVKLRYIDPFAKIIYVTSHNEFIKNVIDEMIMPFAYISKNTQTLENDLRRVLEKVQAQYLLELEKNTNADKIAIKLGAKQMYFDIKDILYFETVGEHKISLKTKGGNELQFFGTLAKIEQLRDSFFNCHRSYVINMDNVKSYSKEKIIFQNNEEHYFPDTAIRKIRKELKKKN